MEGHGLYKYFTNAHSWANASKFRNKVEGGNLVVIDTEAEAQVISLTILFLYPQQLNIKVFL